MNVFIVIPAYNEEATIGDLVRRLIQSYDYPIVVVNDLSEDRTSTVARNAGAVVLDMPIHLGAWCCTQTGIHFAIDSGAAIIVTMDADGQHTPDDVKTIVQCLTETNSDMVIGSCVGRGSAARKLAWLFFRTIGRVTFADVTSGFRGYNVEAGRVITDCNFSLLDFQDMGVIIALNRLGFTIKEVDVEMSCRSCGKSRVFSSWPKTIEYLITTSLFIIAKRLY